MARPGTVLPAAILSLGGLYVVQSVLGGFIWTTLPAVLRARGVDIEDLGFLSLLVLPWALKFLWSARLEAFRRPPSGAVRTKAVVAVGAALILGAMLLLRSDLPLPAMIAVLFVVATVTATVDIACDGHAVEAFPAAAYGWANMMQVGGAYLGSAIGGGLLMIAVDRMGWDRAIALLVGLCAALILPFLLLRQPPPLVPPAPRGQSLRAAVTRTEVRRGLIVTVLFVFAMKSVMALYGPFLIDRGMTLSEVGLFSATGSAVSGILGAMFGGLLVSRIGTGRLLIAALVVQAAILICCIAVSVGLPLPAQALAVATQLAGTAGLSIGFVALYARFMEWSDRGQAGVDFTLFQSADAAASMILGLLVTQIAGRAGYGATFTLAIAATTVCAFGLHRKLSARAVAVRE